MQDDPWEQVAGSVHHPPVSSEKILFILSLICISNDERSGLSGSLKVLMFLTTITIKLSAIIP